jgi:hypothetical protein
LARLIDAVQVLRREIDTVNVSFRSLARTGNLESRSDQAQEFPASFRFSNWFCALRVTAVVKAVEETRRVRNREEIEMKKCRKISGPTAQITSYHVMITRTQFGIRQNPSRVFRKLGLWLPFTPRRNAYCK